MYHITETIAQNDRAMAAYLKARAETETNRRCSYCGDSEKGLVLHSAKKRSTAFLPPGNPSKVFLAAWFGTNSEDARDRLVESHF